VSGPSPDWTDPKAWSGPWADDARRAFGLLQGAVGQVIADPQVQGLLHRAAPELLDRVSDLAAGLAATLRAQDGDGPTGPDTAADPPVGERPRPPSTVRIDVTDE
jgi:hypothetical protein